MLNYYFKNKAIRINCIGVINDKDAIDDFFNTKLSNSITDSIQSFLENGKCSNISIIKSEESEKRFYLDNKSKIIYAFFNIICKKETDVIFMTQNSCPGKLWINHKLRSLNNQWFSPFLVTTLNKGSNIIIFEFHNFYSYFSLRISSYDFENTSSYEALINGKLNYITPSLTIVSENQKNNNTMKFMVSLNDTIKFNIKNGAYIKLIQKSSSEILEEFRCDFFKLYEYNYSKLIHNQDGNLDNIKLICQCTNLEGKIFTMENYIQIFNNEKFIKNMLSTAIELLNSNKITEYDKLNLRHYIKEMYNNEWSFALLLERIFEVLKSGKHMDETLYSKGAKYKYFISKLDNTLELYNVYVPKSYNPNNKYPLILYLSTERYSHYSNSYENEYDGDVIVADISGRGVTLGSYIGESSFFDFLQDIKNTFSIDDERIYLTGTSNGAFSTWSLAQNQPDLFAGIYPVSGEPYYPNIMNVYNINTIVASSYTEYLYIKAYKIPLKFLKRLKNIKLILTDEMIHNDLGYLMLKKQFIDDILKVKLEKYPNKIYFRSERNRYLKAYWIKIYSIAFSKKYTKLKAEIKDNLININIVNANAFAINIPPQINKQCFHIIVNNKVFYFKNYKSDSINFLKERKGYIITNKQLGKSESRKGIGLLDIYFNTLNIIVSNMNKKTLLNVADAFSQPNTNGFDSKVYTNYPIFNSTDFNTKILECNLILIDDGSINSNFNYIKKHLKIKVDNNGFEYKEKKYTCDYCVMQIISNPQNTNYSILYISTNNEKLLKQNLFTRKVVIPSYANGVHPYWNNEALIYMDGKHYGIYEWGMDIEEII